MLTTSCKLLFVAFCIAASAFTQQHAAPQLLPDDPFAALAAMPAQPPVADGLQVLVHAADGTPSKDAIVVLMASSAGDYQALRVMAEQRYPGDEPRILAARATHGVRYAVSEQGSTMVPSDQRGRLVAVCGDLLASVIRDNVGAAGGKRVVLRLLPATTFAVEVTTVGGQPAAGAVLGLCAAPGEFPFPQCTTDNEGRATFRVVPGRGENAIVQALLAAAAPPSAALPTLEGTKVQLQLPPCGSIEAKLSAELAAELLPGTQVAWALRDQTGRTAQPSPPSTLPQATFRYVEAGFTGELTCGLASNAQHSVSVADLLADETRVVTIAAETGEQPTLVMRLLTADGQPLRNSSVEIDWDYANGGQNWSEQSNGEGWLQLDVPASARDSSTLLLEVRDAAWNGRLLGATELKLGALKERRTQQGELRLAAPSIAVTGRVVDLDGKPVVDLRLSATRQDKHRTYQLLVADDGRFEVQMVEPHPPQIALQLISDGWYLVEQPGEPRLCDKDERDVLLRVQRGGRVRFAAAGYPHDANTTFESYWLNEANQQRLDVDNTLQEGTLPVAPGAWSLVFESGGREVHRIDHVVVASGVETHDARLMFFDWQCFAAVATIHVQGADGKPSDDCTVWHHYANGATGTSPSEGTIQWLVPKLGVHMTVEPEQGFAEIDLGEVTGGDYTVRFGKGPRLLVVMASLPALPEGTTLQIAAERSDDWQPFAADGSAELWLEQTGGCRPRLALHGGERRMALDLVLKRAEVAVGGARLDVPADEALVKAIEAAAAKLH